MIPAADWPRQPGLRRCFPDSRPKGAWLRCHISPQSTGLEALKAEYDAAGRGKEVLSVLDFGINPGLKLPADKPIHAWSRAGMVTVVVGDNSWAGGDINIGFGMVPYLSNATVAVDGRTVIRDGKLATAEEMAAN